MFIPTTPQELADLGWDALDVILVSGDTYIDTPYSGIAIIGHQLLAAGYKVGIIAQPALDSPEDITRLGQPRLFWGVSAGLVDSLVANTTPLGKPRQYDDHTPGGLNNRRPDRATIVYSNLIRRYFKGTVPIVLGGIEASLRRVAHYDYWSDSLRRSVLLDAKADYIMYGMADLTVLELAETLRNGGDPRTIRGLCYTDSSVPEGYLELPSFEEVQADKAVFTSMFHTFYHNNDPISAQGLAQRYADRYVIQNPPAPTLTTEQMDAVYSLPFEHAAHPYYAAQGEIRALDTIRFSIPTHRGCYGECNFCAIAVHEGRRVSWRSQESILAEAEQMSDRQGFTGIIHDLSGPTANMYGFECRVKATRGACQDKSCIYPQVCPLLGVNHQPHTQLLQKLRELPGIRKVFVGSGIRHDMVITDANYGEEYLEELTVHHVSGQLKLAPEHSESSVLMAMRKPSTRSLVAFKDAFDQISARENIPQFLSYYMIAAHPGCTQSDMLQLRKFAGETLGVLPEQVQIFTPTPSTYSSLMYYTEHDPWSGAEIFVEKDLTEKMRQKASITGWKNQKRGQTAERATMNESDDRQKNRNRGYQRDDRPRQDEGVTETGPDGLTWKKEGENRVIRDDYAHFFNNKLPEGWVDKRNRQDRPMTHNRPSGPRGRWNDGEKPYSNRDASSPRPEGDRPYTPRTEGDRPYKPRTEGYQGSNPRPSGDRPYRPSGDRPYRPRPEGTRPYTPRAESDSPQKEGDQSSSPRPEGAREYRPRTKGYQGSNPRPSGDRPYRPSGDRPYRPRTEGDRPYRPRTEGDRPYRPRTEGDRPYTPRAEGDRPYTPRSEGDRAFKPRTEGYQGSNPRPSGDRPYRPAGDRPYRPSGDRPYRPRSEGDRPYKPRAEGDRPYTPRAEGDRPYTPRAEGNRPYKPRTEGYQGSNPRPSGDRPYRPTGDRPYKPRTEGDRPYKPRTEGYQGSNPRPTGDRPYRPSGDRPYKPRTEGDRPYKPRTEGYQGSNPRPSGDRPYRPHNDQRRSSGGNGPRRGQGKPQDRSGKPSGQDRGSSDRAPKKSDSAS